MDVSSQITSVNASQLLAMTDSLDCLKGSVQPATFFSLHVITDATLLALQVSLRYSCAEMVR